MFNFKYKNFVLGFLLLMAGVIGGQSSLVNTGIGMVVGGFTEQPVDLGGVQ